jgi:hypothetical protein
MLGGVCLEADCQLPDTHHVGKQLYNKISCVLIDRNYYSIAKKKAANCS